MSAITDAALQAVPAAKARGYWATVGRRITRDKVSMVCALVLLVWAHPIDNSPHYPWYVLCDSVADHISHAGDWVDL